MAMKKRVMQERRNTPPIKRVCIFCENGTEPIYTDTAVLRKFMNDRARISLRARTGACSKHQRRVTKEIKHARHLALLPFVPTT
jgi:small subunit ribosomal protein S18